jgi:hypothetical protein
MSARHASMDETAEAEYDLPDGVDYSCTASSAAISRSDTRPPRFLIAFAAATMVRAINESMARSHQPVSGANTGCTCAATPVPPA